MMNLRNISRGALKLGLVAAVAAAGWLDAKPAEAGTATANLSVGATVSANCTISTSALSFGAYDPVSANHSTALVGTGGVTINCTSGSTATVTLDQGQNPASGSTNAAPLRQMNDGASDNLAYALYQDSSRTTVWGNTAGTGSGQTGNGTAQGLTVYGAVAPGQNVPAGTYSDTVTATVTF
jgi:spore coat protein U-like protein